MDPSQVSPDLIAYLRGLFAPCNNTELYQIARQAGHLVLPSLSHEELIDVIIGAAEPPPLYEHTADEYRLAMMRFIIDHRSVLETQVKCPAKSFQPDACFGCLDQQIFHCYVTNPSSQHLIQLHMRKKA